MENETYFELHSAPVDQVQRCLTANVILKYDHVIPAASSCSCLSA